MAPIWCLPRPFSKNLLFQKRSLKPTNFEHFKNIFFISGSNFIGLFNGTLFVFIISVVAETQKETFLPSRFNWPPLYIRVPNLENFRFLLELVLWTRGLPFWEMFLLKVRFTPYKTATLYLLTQVPTEIWNFPNWAL